jgi:hypothetical protein
VTRIHRFVAVALVALAATPATASAHKGDPNFLSTIKSVTGMPDGVDVSILNREDELLLINRSGRDLMVLGYEGEPYARIDADGTVAVNERSVAFWTNQERDGIVDVPDSADSDAEPAWRTLDRSGRFSWHDHRIHWMAEGRPPQVKDPDERTKIFDWDVEVRVAGAASAATIAGVLEWTPDEDGGAPVAAIVGFVVLLLGSAALVIVVRRRRAGENADETTDAPAKEAW